MIFIQFKDDTLLKQILENGGYVNAKKVHTNK